MPGHGPARIGARSGRRTRARTKGYGVQLGRRRHATAVAVAVIGGLLGPFGPAAVAAPVTPAATAADRAGDTGLPAVWPRPQSVEASGRAVTLGTEVTLLPAPEADPYAVDALRGSCATPAYARCTTPCPAGGR